MAYTNSSLVSYKKLSPNHSGQRTHAIDTITIHCVVGQVTVERLGDIFAVSSRKASANYGVGADGKIGLYVEEKNRSWCSSSNANDQRAVTIEVASDTKEPYAVNQKAYDATIQLVADICKRNSIKKLVWSNDKNTRLLHLNGCNMTVHRDYANKSCPGTYLYNHMGDIADKVNAILTAPKTGTKCSGGIKIGDTVTFMGKKHWPSIRSIKDVECKPGKAVVLDYCKSGDHQYLLKAVKGGGSNVYGWCNCKDIYELYPDRFVEEKLPALYQVTCTALNVRKGPGVSYVPTGVIRDKGTYTIIEIVDGWGKLKSGTGWICLDYAKKV